MSNQPANRPSTTRKRTTKTEANRDKALDESFAIKVDDETYNLVPADITGLTELKIRRDTGFSVTEIISKMQSAPGMDVIGCFMYACEVAAGRDADLEGILGSISWASDFDVVDGEGVPVPQR